MFGCLFRLLLLLFLLLLLLLSLELSFFTSDFTSNQAKKKKKSLSCFFIIFYLCASSFLNFRFATMMMMKNSSQLLINIVYCKMLYSLAHTLIHIHIGNFLCGTCELNSYIRLSLMASSAICNI